MNYIASAFLFAVAVMLRVHVVKSFTAHIFFQCFDTAKTSTQHREVSKSGEEDSKEMMNQRYEKENGVGASYWEG